MRSTDYVYFKNKYGDGKQSVEKYFNGSSTTHRLPVNVTAIYGKQGAAFSPSCISASDNVHRQVTSSTACASDKLISHFAVTDTLNHKVSLLRLQAREDRSIPWEAVFARRDRSKTNDGGSSKKGLTLAMPQLQSKRLKAVSGLDAYSSDKLEHEKVSQAYKRMNSKATDDEIRSILVEYTNAKKSDVLNEIDTARNLNQEIHVRLEDADPRVRVVRANGKRFRRILGKLEPGPRPLPFRYYPAKVLGIDRKRGTIHARFTSLGELGHAGTLGVGHVNERAASTPNLNVGDSKPPAEAGATSHEDFEVSIFDVINAQDKFEQGKILEKANAISCRGTDPGKFQFPKYASFGCNSIIYVSDNDQSRLGSPRVQAFKLSNLSVGEVVDNSSVKGVSELADMQDKEGEVSNFVTLRRPDGTILSRTMSTWIEVSANATVPTSEVETLGAHELVTATDTPKKCKNHFESVVRLRGLVVRWEHNRHEEAGGPAGELPETKHDEVTKTMSNSPDSGIGKDYTYVFHYKKKKVIVGGSNRPSVLHEYSKRAIINEDSITPLFVQCRYRCVYEAETASGWGEVFTSYCWGRLYGLDAATGQYIVTVDKKSLSANAHMRRILLNEQPGVHCQYPLVDHAQIRMTPSVPQPVFKIPHGITSSIALNRKLQKNRAGNRAARGGGGAVVFTADRLGHCVHAIQFANKLNGNAVDAHKQGSSRSQNISGKYLYSFGTHGSSPGQLVSPHGLCEHQNRIFVCDTGNNRIQCFRFMARRGHFTNGLHDFDKSGDHVQNEGDWHVECMYPDDEKSRIGKWQHSSSLGQGKEKGAKKLLGNRLSHHYMYEGKGNHSKPGVEAYNPLLLGPEDVCVDALGFVIVADTGHHCIRVFGIEEEEPWAEKNIKKQDLLSEEEFKMVPVDQRWKYSHYKRKNWRVKLAGLKRSKGPTLPAESDDANVTSADEYDSDYRSDHSSGTKQEGKKHGKRKQRQKETFYRSVPNVRLVLLATWGQVGAAPGFFRFPRSVSTFSWLLPSNVNRSFDASNAGNLVQNIAVVDGGNSRVQLIEYHLGQKDKWPTVGLQQEHVKREAYKNRLMGCGGRCSIS